MHATFCVAATVVPCCYGGDVYDAVCILQHEQEQENANWLTYEDFQNVISDSCEGVLQLDFMQKVSLVPLNNTDIHGKWWMLSAMEFEKFTLCGDRATI